MQPLKKIEDRTIWFIAAYNKLDAQKKLPSNVDLAAIMGMASKSTVSNILNKHQNIQPDQWQKFRDYFGLQDGNAGSELTEPEPTMKELLAGLTAGFRAIAETMRSMEGKMALESSLQEALAGVETIADRQGPAIQKILSDLAELKGRGNAPS